jgi:hypothetical protein
MNLNIEMALQVPRFRFGVPGFRCVPAFDGIPRFRRAWVPRF